MLTAVATTVSDDGFVRLLPFVIATVYVAADGAVYVNVPVDPTPAASVTGVLVIVPPVGVTVTVTVTEDASEPFVPIVKLLEALPTGTALGPVSVNAVAGAGAYPTVAVCDVPPGPVTVTVAVPVPLLGVVSVKPVPLVGDAVDSVPAVVDADRGPLGVSVAVSDAATLLPTD